MAQTWKKYGGINQFDSSTHITTNSIITETFAMRTPYNGTFSVSGELLVFGDASVHNNLSVRNNLYVENDLYLKDHLYIGNESDHFLYSDFNGVGINTTTPSAVLDISGTSEHMINVYSSADKTTNILARNKHNDSISLQVDISQAAIIFHHSDQSSNIIFEPSGNRIRFRDQVAVGHNPVIGTASFTVAPHTVAPHTVVTVAPHTVGSDTTDSSIYNCVPLQVCSSDISTNSLGFFSNSINQGWYYGGGCNNTETTSRQTGIMGWRDISGHFIPSQIQVSGNYLKENKSTTGINRYNPRAEKCVLDVNGPVVINHQEIREVINTTFNIHSVSFSKTNPSFGIAVGEGVVVKKRTDVSYQSVNHILITSDYGITWRQEDISFNITDIVSSKQTTLGVYAFADSNAVIVSKSPDYLNIFRTSSQGASWDISYARGGPLSGDSFFDSTAASRLQPYVIDIDTIILAEVDISVDKITAYDQGSYTASYGSAAMPNTQVTSLDGSGNHIITVDTSGNINRYLYQNNNGLVFKGTIHNTNSAYYFVETNTQQTIACGQNIISIHIGPIPLVAVAVAVPFVDISFSNPGLKFNHAIVYDSNHAIAVGDEGAIYYAISDITKKTNWYSVTTSMIDGMGNSLRLKECDLMSVKSIDTSGNFIFVSRSRILHGYFPDILYPDDSPPLLTIEGHIETHRDTIKLFDNHVQTVYFATDASNTYLDMCGTVHMNQSVHNSSTHTNITADNLHISEGVFFHDICYNSPVIKADASALLLNCSVRVAGNIQVDGTSNLLVGFGPTGLSTDLQGTMMNQMHVNFTETDISNNAMGSGFYIDMQLPSTDGNSNPQYTHPGFMKVSNEQPDKLSFRSVSHANVVSLDFPNIQTFTDSRNALLVLQKHNAISVINDISDNFYIQSSHSTNQTIDVSAAMMNIFDLGVNNNVDISGELAVLGKAQFNNHVQIRNGLGVEGDVSFNSNTFDVSGDVLFSSELVVHGDVSFNQKFDVYGDSLFSSDVGVKGMFDVSGDVLFSSDFVVHGDVSLNQKFDVYGNSLFSSNVGVKGALDVLGDFVVGGDIYIHGAIQNGLDVYGNVMFDDSLYVENDVSFNSTLEVAGSVLIGNKSTFVDRLFKDIDFTGNINTFPLRNGIYYTNYVPASQLYRLHDSSNNTTSPINIITTGNYNAPDGYFITYSLPYFVKLSRFYFNTGVGLKPNEILIYAYSSVSSNTWALLSTIAANNISLNVNTIQIDSSQYYDNVKIYFKVKTYGDSINLYYVDMAGFILQPPSEYALNVYGETMLNNTLSVTGDVTLNNRLDVNGTTTLFEYTGSIGDISGGTLSLTHGNTTFGASSIIFPSSASSQYGFIRYLDDISNNNLIQKINYPFLLENSCLFMGAQHTVIRPSHSLVLDTGTSATTRIGTGEVHISPNGGNVYIGKNATSAAPLRLSIGGDISCINHIITASSFNATSDYRMKENIQTICGDYYSVDKLRPVSYTLTESNEPHMGFIAHEVQEQFPTAVRGEKDGETIQSINYSELIPVLVKEIQELKEKVAFLLLLRNG